MPSNQLTLLTRHTLSDDPEWLAGRRSCSSRCRCGSSWAWLPCLQCKQPDFESDLAAGCRAESLTGVAPQPNITGHFATQRQTQHAKHHTWQLQMPQPVFKWRCMIQGHPWHPDLSPEALARPPSWFAPGKTESDPSTSYEKQGLLEVAIALLLHVPRHGGHQGKPASQEKPRFQSLHVALSSKGRVTNAICGGSCPMRSKRWTASVPLVCSQ